METKCICIIPLICKIVKKIFEEFIVNKFFKKNKGNTVINIKNLSIGTIVDTVVNHNENQK